ncbi:MAG: universal stress protein [Planctomycetes bacterium]|nr:universal stress protein [Planctomycetota bacterium]
MTAPLILLTTDFSPDAERAYAPTLALAERLGARILLLHVVEVTAVAPHGAPLAPALLPPDTPQLVGEAKVRILEAAARLGRGVPVDTLVETGTDIVQQITRVARERKADYIAISTHGRTGLRRLVLGSIAEAVVRHAHIPVLCFPGHEPGDGGGS